ncbi:helix-turn-helix domain-containing protein [Arundinibacter roseus]|uniref:XRE family transcriptional regulator n=1 Tax=Arundinibacter roseus TaxID=2070510 RepID=A0A4R4KA71_9BACT|nr:helix-turn-helix transcriptional regulator [Arundinibacter roseus]TDB64453.1 XRE family transcriptional regulator [Arundinibacter roseus]
MALNTENVKLVFGLKLKQLRLDRGLSLNEVSQKSGLSISYINEIEKGKKYPKSDKIIALATALEVEYDSLVSLKLSKRLEPISELLSSNILTELPLDLFGIDPSSLLEMLSDAPTKVSAFIGTLIEISRNYNMSVEQFYFSALRTYQEMHDNYFEEIEHSAEQFLAEKNCADEFIPDENYLSELLKHDFSYTIESINLDTHPELKAVRSLLIPQNSGNKLLINKNLSSVQKSFIYGRELGYQYLKLKNRLYTTALVEADSFEQLLNNFKASYFASAIIIRRNLLVPRLKSFFSLPSWQPGQLLEMIEEFNTTPESFCYRLSNILPKHFGINQIFFLRFHNFAGQNQFDLTKEMHIARKHIPHTVKDEYYCRRWLALTILQDLEALMKPKPFLGTLCKGQISTYVDSSEKYLMISFAKSMSTSQNLNVSVTMGIFLNEDTRKIIHFLDDSALKHKEVNETCERCMLFDCRERMAAPIVLQKRRNHDELKKTIAKMIGNAAK